MVHVVPAHGNSMTPFFGGSEAKYVDVPASTMGTIMISIGRVPMRFGIKSSFIIPHSTEVGQSGPPINT